MLSYILVARFHFENRLPKVLVSRALLYSIYRQMGLLQRTSGRTTTAAQRWIVTAAVVRWAALIEDARGMVVQDHCGLSTAPATYPYPRLLSVNRIPWQELEEL